MPPLTEQDYFDAFGIGAKEQDSDAGPAPDSGTQVTGETSTTQQDSGSAAGAAADTGGPYDDDHDGSAADLAGADGTASKDSKESNDIQGDGTAGSSQATDEPEDDPGLQEPDPDGEGLTPEERRANAARRREREQQDAIDKAVGLAVNTRVAEIVGAERAQMESEWSSFFRKAKLENPVTGKAISTKAEFDAWEQEEAAAQMQRDLAEGNLTPEFFQKMIAENPVIKRAEELERQRAREAMDARVNAELAEISKLDPSVKTLEDATKLPTGPAFIRLVRENGYSFLDAFKVANFDRLSTAKAARDAAAAKQQAIQNVTSKGHLTESAIARGGGSVLITVPDAVKKNYRMYSPEMSDADIQKDYNKRVAHA